MCDVSVWLSPSHLLPVGGVKLATLWHYVCTCTNKVILILWIQGTSGSILDHKMLTFLSLVHVRTRRHQFRKFLQSSNVTARLLPGVHVRVDGWPVQGGGVRKWTWVRESKSQLISLISSLTCLLSAPKVKKKILVVLSVISIKLLVCSERCCGRSEITR